MNDDLVQPARGFGEHPHSNVEICTYVVGGHLTHKDSMGTEETLSRGAVQFMTAGTGVRHQEHNLHKSEPLRFIQMWINTRKRGLAPNYGSSSGEEASRQNRWSHLVSDVLDATAQTPIKINQVFPF
jgi:redox-sensitive bicupin YhaK (pirin superfamily)